MTSQLDLEEINEVYRGTGSAPYPPVLMLAIVLFEILRGVSSPAQWHRDASTRDQCKLLGQGITPSRTAWYDFRDRAAKFTEKIHQQLVGGAIERELIDPYECSLDGTFTAASASRHKIFNLKQINRRLNKLKRAVRSLDDASQVASQKELPTIPAWIAPTSSGRDQQLNRYRQAKLRLLEKIDENRQKHCRYRRDESKMVISPADVDAVIGKDKHKVIRPLYNTQCMTDCASDVIVAFGVYAQSNDSGTLAPMINKSQEATDGRVKTVHADSGYCSILELKDCQLQHIDLYAPVQDNRSQPGRKSAGGESQIPSRDFVFDEATQEMTCPQGNLMKRVRTVQVPRADGRTLGEFRFEQSVDHCCQCPLASRCLGPNAKRRTVSRQVEQSVLDRQIEKMNTPEGKRSKKIRAQVIERRFADGKKHRGQGIQNGRGLFRVQAEVGLLVIAQNTLTLYNLEIRRKDNKP